MDENNENVNTQEEEIDINRLMQVRLEKLQEHVFGFQQRCS